MPATYFEPTSDRSFRIFFSYDRQQLVSREEVASTEGRVLTKEIFGTPPRFQSNNIYLGTNKVFCYNYNPFKGKLFEETIYERWLLKRMTLAEVKEAFVEILLAGLLEQGSTAYFGQPSDQLNAFHQGVLGMINKTPRTIQETVLLNRLHSLYRMLEDLDSKVEEYANFKRGPLIQEFSSLVVFHALHQLNALPQTIHIALCGNKTLFPHMEVLMLSVIYNTQSPVHFHLFLSDPLPDETLERMRFIVALKLPSQVSVYDVNLGMELGEFQMDQTNKQHFMHITIDTYTRLLIPNKLPTLNKVIYMDVDIIVERDLRELWNYPLEEGHALAMAQEPDQDFYQSVWAPVFQAGVILMRLDLLREQNFEMRIRERARREMKEEGAIVGQDQGLISREFGDKITKLGFLYNFCSFLFGPNVLQFIEDREACDFLFGEELTKRIAVYHYAGPKKAWDRRATLYHKYLRIHRSLQFLRED